MRLLGGWIYRDDGEHPVERLAELSFDDELLEPGEVMLRWDPSGILHVEEVKMTWWQVLQLRWTALWRGRRISHLMGDVDRRDVTIGYMQARVDRLEAQLRAVRSHWPHSEAGHGCTHCKIEELVKSAREG